MRKEGEIGAERDGRMRETGLDRERREEKGGRMTDGVGVR